MKRTSAVVLVAFFLGSLTGGIVTAAGPAPVTLQPGEQITIIAATPAPTPTPTATPTPTPSCPASLQTAINGASSSLNVTGCTFHETVTISKPFTLTGGTIDGDNTRTLCLAVRNTNDVTITGTTVIRCANATQQGAIDSDNSARVTLDRVTVTDCSGAAVAGSGGSDFTVQYSTLARCAQEGFSGNLVGGRGYYLLSNSIHDNGGCCAAQGGPLWETGGGKVGRGGGLWEGNEVYSNLGPGLWCDITCTNVTIRNNRVHDNTYAGIFYEISSGGLIENNTVWRNGAGDTRGWGWPAGILVSTSRTTEVRNNTLAWNQAGISVITQSRSDSPGTATGLYVHDNTVITDGKQFELAWLQDYSTGTLYSDATNRGLNGKYWSSTAEPQTARFVWNWPSHQTTLAAFNATPGEEAGVYLTTAQKDAALSAAGIP